MNSFSSELMILQVMLPMVFIRVDPAASAARIMLINRLGAMVFLPTA